MPSLMLAIPGRASLRTAFTGLGPYVLYSHNVHGNAIALCTGMLMRLSAIDDGPLSYI